MFLSVFSDPSFALRAVRRMLSHTSAGPLLLHAGLHFGPVVHARGAMFGDAVNTTARLASLAKPGEVLISGNFVAELSEFEAETLRPLDTIRFKGKKTPTQVYSLLGATGAPATEISYRGLSRPFDARAECDGTDVSISLEYRDREYSCVEPGTIVIGRAPDCDLVIFKPWVSRSHATVTARRGKIEISDQSAAGTYAMIENASEVSLHRETLLLTSSGIISPAVPTADDRAEIITYKIDTV